MAHMITLGKKEYAVERIMVRANGDVFIKTTERDTYGLLKAGNEKMMLNFRGDGYEYSTWISAAEHEGSAKMIADAVALVAAAAEMVEYAPGAEHLKPVAPVEESAQAVEAPVSFFDTAVVKMVVARVDALEAAGGSVTTQHITESRTLARVADMYVTDASPANAFYDSLRRQLRSNGALTVKQRLCALRDMLTTARNRAAQPAPAADPFTLDFSQIASQPAKAHQASQDTPKSATGSVDGAVASSGSQKASESAVDRGVAGVWSKASKTAQVTKVLPNGTYTVGLSDGTHITIKLTDAYEAWSFSAGTQVAAYLIGPDNSSDYVQYALVQGALLYPKKTFDRASNIVTALLLLTGDSAAWRAYGEAYAIRSGVCWRCGRKLTVPASVHAGLGPICARELNAEYGAVPQPGTNEVAEISGSTPKKRRSRKQPAAAKVFSDNSAVASLVDDKPAKNYQQMLDEVDDLF